MSFYSRYQRTRQFDDASLQTDVMRFMAIVAFCLIAILAVVRNIEAPAVSETIEPVVSTVQVAPTDQVRSTAPAPIPPKPESEETAQTRLLEPPIEPTIETKAAELMVEAQEPAQPMASLEVLPSDIQPLDTSPPTEPTEKPAAPTEPALPEATPEPASVATTPDQPAESPQTAPRDPKAPIQEEGLSLRFVSDSDFLRLVSRGAVTVIAFRNNEYFALNRAYRFVATTPPHQFHELDANTIPALLHSSLTNSGLRPAPWQWAVILPERITKQISQHLNTHRAGELRIDKFQRVHHVSS